jgi:hypothetical protein
MASSDGTAMAVAFAKTIARIADFAVDLAETLHKDLGLEYNGPSLNKSKVISKKRSRSERDPNEPKRPQTAYMIYSAFLRDDLKKRGEPQPQLKEIADMWAKLDEKDRERFAAEAQSQKESYDRLMAEYKAKRAPLSSVQKSEESASSNDSVDAEDVVPPAKLVH